MISNIIVEHCADVDAQKYWILKGKLIIEHKYHDEWENYVKSIPLLTIECDALRYVLEIIEQLNSLKEFSIIEVKPIQEFSIKNIFLSLFSYTTAAIAILRFCERGRMYFEFTTEKK